MMESERLGEQRAFAKHSLSTLRGRSRGQRREEQSRRNASVHHRFFQTCTHCTLARRLLLPEVPYTLPEAARITFGLPRHPRSIAQRSGPPLQHTDAWSAALLRSPHSPTRRPHLPSALWEPWCKIYPPRAPHFCPCTYPQSGWGGSGGFRRSRRRSST